MLLGPTHEEEITQLVAAEVTSYRQLPLLLYQTSMAALDPGPCTLARPGPGVYGPMRLPRPVTPPVPSSFPASSLAARKFRDEVRPRFGLIRGREFVMKDLYTFDETASAAMATYASVCRAYDRIFQRLGLPFVKVRPPPAHTQKDPCGRAFSSGGVDGHGGPL